MKKNILITLITLLFAMQAMPAEAKAGPIIHIDPVTYTFAAVFEGQPLTHDFKVQNKGSADLEIKDVTHQ